MGLVRCCAGANAACRAHVNGNWRRTPGLRFIGAMTGLIWWLIISALYALAVQRGARIFRCATCSTYSFSSRRTPLSLRAGLRSPKARDAGIAASGAGNG